ncbi:MAG: MmgE/PrpD family protein [Desulfovibrionaceae bacterium]
MITRSWSPSAACTDFVAELAPAAIPAQAIDCVKRYYLDWLGCAVGGMVDAQAKAIQRITAEAGGTPQAHVLGTTQRTALGHAAMCNGYFGHILEMDDVDRTSISHPATVNIPAALAVGEYLHKSGIEMLTAIVAGYEVMLRIGTAITPNHYKIWHTTATTGVFGAAMAAGWLLGLRRPQLDWALGNAGTMAAGLWQFLPDGGMSKFLHAGMAASNGVLAANLAHCGFTGATHILEGAQGFFAGYARQAVDENLFRDFGTFWRSAGVSFKPYPCCRHTHSGIDAAMDICRQAAGEPISKVTVGTYSTALQVAGALEPTDTRTAKFSLRYCIASTLLRGTAQEEYFSLEAVTEPKVQQMLHKVVMAVDPEIDKKVPKSWPCSIEAVTVSGKILKSYSNDPTGDPENPLTWDGVIKKFRFMTGGIISTAAADGAIDYCKNLENVRDCGEIFTILSK